MHIEEIKRFKSPGGDLFQTMHQAEVRAREEEAEKVVDIIINPKRLNPHEVAISLLRHLHDVDRPEISRDRLQAMIEHVAKSDIQNRA